MIGNRTGQLTGEISVCRMEGQELYHRSVEIFDVFGLSFIPASGVGIFAFGVSLGGSLDFSWGLIAELLGLGGVLFRFGLVTFLGVDPPPVVIRRSIFWVQLNGLVEVGNCPFPIAL